MAARIDPSPRSTAPVIGSPTLLFDAGAYLTSETPGVHSDTSPDGRRILMIKKPAPQVALERPGFVVVTNWIGRGTYPFSTAFPQLGTGLR
jgi:hypothetical protein